MPEPLASLQGWSLADRGPSLDLDLHEHEWYAVMGRAGSGKSSLLDALLGKPSTRGRAWVSSRPVEAAIEPGRRATPYSRGIALAGKNAPSEISAALSALGLWEDRKTPLHRLPGGLQRAADLLPCLLAPSGSLLLVHGILDLLDPWALPGALAALAAQVEAGCAALVLTNRPEVADRIGSLIVLSEGCPRFVGTTAELLSRSRPAEIEVQTDDRSSVAALVAPFCLSIRKGSHGLTMTTKDGMETAARLLVQGYGRVQAVVLREPTLAEALSELY